MSLAPNEHRVLTQIEDSLRRSDPKLAAMLTSFNRTASGEKIPATERLSPWRARLRRILPVVAACLVIALLAASFVMLGRVGHPAGQSAGACAAAPARVTACRRPGLGTHHAPQSGSNAAPHPGPQGPHQS
jgi:hypothetical protein